MYLKQRMSFYTNSTGHQPVRDKSTHKTSTSSSSSISTPTDKDSTNNAAKFILSLVNGTSNLHHNLNEQLQPKQQQTPQPKQQQQQQQPQQQTAEPDHVVLRNLETWHDEDEEPLDDSCYQELVDPSNSNGWSADEMFKYNEKMHKIFSNYNEKTLSANYTTPLPKINSKTTMKLATQLAKEIEDRVISEGRITPESSDDDELFENEKVQRIKRLKQQKQLKEQLRDLQRQQQQQHRFSNHNNSNASSKTTKSSSHYSNPKSPEITSTTASLSSSPTLNISMIKPVTSSSRNILRTCLTQGSNI